MNTKHNMVAAILFCLVYLAGSSNVEAQELHIYSDIKQTKYLGCLTCSKFSSNSIWNEYGTYGSQYSNSSIWNQYGTYGSPYNVQSPWNEFSSRAPVLIDNAGIFYGFFTRNTSMYNRTTDEFAVWVLDNYNFIINNFSRVVSKLN